MPNVNVQQQSFFNIHNAQIPPEGPRALGATLNFFNGNISAQVDLTSTQMNGQISYVQGVFIDGSASPIAIVMQVQGATYQKIICPAGAQVYAPILAQNPPIFNFAGAGNASANCLVPVFFVNVPMPALQLGNVGVAGMVFSGSNLLVQDTAAETALAALTALITNQGSGNGLDVNVLSGGGGGGGGGFAGPMTWHGVNVGSGATLYTPAAGKRFYVNNIKVYADPSATRAAGQNNFAIQDGGSFVLQVYWEDVAAAPTLTGITGPVVLFSADDMGWLSSTVNNSLIFTINHNMGSANAIWCNFSTLTGDHA